MQHISQLNDQAHNQQTDALLSQMERLSNPLAFSPLDHREEILERRQDYEDQARKKAADKQLSYLQNALTNARAKSQNYQREHVTTLNKYVSAEINKCALSMLLPQFAEQQQEDEEDKKALREAKRRQQEATNDTPVSYTHLTLPTSDLV